MSKAVAAAREDCRAAVKWQCARVFFWSVELRVPVIIYYFERPRKNQEKTV
jgi:hypothetical protein